MTAEPRGGVPEWSNGAVSKAVMRFAYRGFESALPARYFLWIQ